MALPDMIPVTRSSTVDATGYDPETHLLTIRFKGGATYQYQNIQASMYRVLLAAPSIGSYFAQHIKNKPDIYPCTKLDAPKVPPVAAVNEYTSLEERVATLERQLIVVLARLDRHDEHAPAGALAWADWP